jgi:hypothetical protein
VHGFHIELDVLFWVSDLYFFITYFISEKNYAMIGGGGYRVVDKISCKKKGESKM